MSYQALYRKYRPSNLEEVIDQDVVIRILKNSIINNKIGHAYLFSGPRGIGKTTIAKTFAKAVNCLNTKDGNSCGKCDNCLAISNTIDPDIIEIDAASNNGVDEIREIKNKISLVPNHLKYKVYIIDEVHMLSTGAFNALLKTLEEPPEYIIFILATTDVQKVPATIISRCQCFDFHRISNKKIVERLKYIADQEKIDVDEVVLLKIAEISDGGMRDSIGMLDKLSAYSNSKITLEDFEKINGIVSIEQQNEFISYIENGNVTDVIKFIDNIYENGKDLIIFTKNLLNLCKNRCINYYTENNNDNIDFLLELSELFNYILKIIKTSSDVKTLFEINILSFINKKNNNTNLQKTVDKIEKSDNKSQNVVDKKEKKNNLKATTDDKIIDKNNEIIINNCFARASKERKKLFESKIKEFNDYTLDSKIGAAASLIIDGTIRVVGENEVLISFSHDSMVNRGLNLLEMVQKLFEKVYNIYYDVAFITDDEWKKVKDEYIQKINKGFVYEYIPLDKKPEINKNSITDQAREVFGDDAVSI